MTGKQTLEKAGFANAVVRWGGELTQGLQRSLPGLVQPRRVGTASNVLTDWQKVVPSFDCSVYPALVSSLAFSADSQTLVVGHSGFEGLPKHTIEVWNVSTRSQVQGLAGHGNSATLVTTCPGSASIDEPTASSPYYLASSTHEERDIKIWDLAQGALVRTLSGHTNGIRSLAMTPKGQIVASGSYDNTVKLWQFTTGELLHTLCGHTDVVSAVAFDPHGQILATGSYDNTIKIWDVATGKLLHTLVGHTLKITSLAFAPNGYQLVSGSEDRTLKLWKVTTGDLQTTYQGHTSAVLSVAFHPSGQLIATGSADETVKLWSATTGQVLRTLERPLGQWLPGHAKWISAVCFSPDGQSLASGAANGIVKVWQPRSKLSQ